MLFDLTIWVIALLLPAGRDTTATHHRGRREDDFRHSSYCSANVYVVNLYPSHQHLVRVTFPRHDFTPLAYAQHVKAVFDIGVSDVFEVSLLSRNGTVVYPPLRRSLHSNPDFTFPIAHPCSLNVAVIGDMAADGRFEFALEVFRTDATLDGQTRLIVYHGLLRYTGAVDVLVGRGDEVYMVGMRLYLGSRMSGVIPAGSWELKVVPRNAVSKVADFMTVKSLVDPVTLHLSPDEYYYVAVHGNCHSSEYPPALTVIPACGLTTDMPWKTSSEARGTGLLGVSVMVLFLLELVL